MNLSQEMSPARAASLAALYDDQGTPVEWTGGLVREALTQRRRETAASEALRCAPALVDLARPRCSRAGRDESELPSVLTSIAEAWDFLPKDAALRKLAKDRRLALMLTGRPANRNNDAAADLDRLNARKRGRRRTKEHCPWLAAHADPTPQLETRPVYQTDRDHCDRTGVRFLWQCNIEPSHRFWTAQPCSCADCAACLPSLDGRREQRAVGSLGAIDFGAAVLTLPRAWGHHAGPARLRYVRQLAIEVLRAALAPAVWDRAHAQLGPHPLERHARGRKDQIRAGGVAAVHPIGESCDRCGARGKDVGTALAIDGVCPRCGETPTPHAHVDMTVSELWQLSTGFHVNAPLFLERAELDRLQNLWWFALAAMGGLASLDPGPIGQVHYLYRRGQRQRQHRLGYCVRGFPAWALGTAGTARRWGLAAPGAVSKRIRSYCRKLAAQHWQDLHKVPKAEPPDLRCPVEGCPGLLHLDAVTTREKLPPGLPALRIADARGPP